MATVRHKWFGTAQIIRREGDLIVIQYDKTGTKSNLKFPDSFLTKPCLFALDSKLQSEVDAIVEARREEARILREEKEAQRAQEKAAAITHHSGTRRTGRTFTSIQLTGDYETDFESFMLKNGYSAKTENDTKSTVYSYVSSVKAVMNEEGLTWAELYHRISNIASEYDVGGSKSEIGDRGNRTVINALRRFEDFVNHSIL